MNQLRAILFSILVLAPFSRVYCGGDGPTPMLEISIPAQQTDIWTMYGAKSIGFWPRSSTLLYWNADDSVVATTLPQSNVHDDFDQMSTPISKVRSSVRDVMLGKDSPYLTMRQDNGNWVRMPLLQDESAPLHHLYWYRDSIYSYLENTSATKPSVQLYVHSLSDEYNYSSQRCPALTFSGSIPSVLEGNTFPNMVFYVSVPAPSGDRFELWTLKYNVETCELGKWEPVIGSFPGKVLKAYGFQSAQFIAILDHPTLRVAWQSAGNRQYYSVGDEAISLPNLSLPVLITSHGSRELRLISVSDARMGVLHLKGDGEAINVDAVELTDDRMRLFVPRRPPGKVTPRLIELDFDRF